MNTHTCTPCIYKINRLVDWK